MNRFLLMTSCWRIWRTCTWLHKGLKQDKAPSTSRMQVVVSVDIWTLHLWQQVFCLEAVYHYLLIGLIRVIKQFLRLLFDSSGKVSVLNGIGGEIRYKQDRLVGFFGLFIFSIILEYKTQYLLYLMTCTLSWTHRNRYQQKNFDYWLNLRLLIS